MFCDFCQTGILQEEITTIALERHNTLIVLEEVPALVCTQCGEAYTNDVATESLLDRAERGVGQEGWQKDEFSYQ
jgi:YgiT-type zinc finger domain-containing protein